MPEQFDLESFLPYRLSLLSNRVSEAIADSYRQAHHISMSEWRLILVLGQYPESTATELMRYTAMNKVRVSRAVKSLTEKQLISAKSHARDGRSRSLSLTSSGQDLRLDVIPKARACEANLNQALNHKEIKLFGELIDKLLNATAT